MLVDIVSIAILAVICGADDWVAVSDFGKTKESWLRSFLSLPNGIPSHDTFGRVFSLLDPTEFSQGFSRWISSLKSLLPYDVVAIDGKSVRGSFDKAADTNAIHLVSAWANEANLLLGQIKVDSKSNEITAIPKLLDMLDLKGATVTIDAMGSQRAIAEQVIAKGSQYVLALKGNQPSIHDEIEQTFGQAAAEILDVKSASATQVTDKDHGRIEIRNHWVIEDLGALPYTSTWPSIAAIGIVDRERITGTKSEIQRSYYLLSSVMTAEKFASTIRSHWSIENKLHWSIDVAFNEDKSRVRKDNAPENFATLRRLALALLKDTEAKVGIKNRRLRAGWNHDFLMRVVTGRPQSEKNVNGV